MTSGKWQVVIGESYGKWQVVMGESWKEKKKGKRERAREKGQVTEDKWNVVNASLVKTLRHFVEPLR